MSSRLFVVVGAVLIGVWPVLGQVPGLGRIRGGGSDDKNAKQKQTEKAAKEARNYEKLKQFSQDLYEKDLDFREDVERHYDEVQRTHSEEAFEKNVASPARHTVVHDGDRLRLQTGLYDNKIVQDYVNRVGQKLVPEDADKLFAFRLVAHPIPFAETLSTGTVYISTGLVSMLDNEAQLAYVLAHELAHVYKDHWKLKSLLELGEEEFNKKQETRRRWLALGVAAASAGVAGAATRSGSTALTAGVVGGTAGYLLSHAFIRGLRLDWDKVQEDEADKIAFRVALSGNYDVQEVPKLYVAMQDASKRDQRVGLGFIGSRRRIAERIDNVKELLGATYKADIEQKLKEGKLVGSNPDFAMVMSELKRDNGILAFYHDMFQLARTNLEYAVAQRSNDPAAHYYYGKVMKLVGRTPADHQAADQAFVKAASLDVRNRYYGAHFYRALALMNNKGQKNDAEVVQSLQAYLNAHLASFLSEDARLAAYLPANLDDMYDYMAQAGVVKWTPKAPEGLLLPAAHVGAPAAHADPTLPGAIPAGDQPFLRSTQSQADRSGAQGAIDTRELVKGGAAGAVTGGAAGRGKGAAAGGAAGAAIGAQPPKPKPAQKSK